MSPKARTEGLGRSTVQNVTTGRAGRQGRPTVLNITTGRERSLMGRKTNRVRTSLQVGKEGKEDQESQNITTGRERREGRPRGSEHTTGRERRE